MAGHLILIPTPIGNLGDITIRSIELLNTADVVACEDTRRTGALLDHLGIVKKLVRFDDHADESVYRDIQAYLTQDLIVAYCSDAGMPGINDPGFEILRLAREVSSQITVLPGASAVLMGVVASGLPCHKFSFLGYLPNKNTSRQEALKLIAGREETTLVFEAPHRIQETLKEIHRLMPDREIALGRELTKMYESWYRGTPEEVIASLGAEDRGEMVLVIAGADSKQVIHEKHAPTLGDTLPEWALRYLEAARSGGMTLREAAKPLARHFGVTASEIYRMAVEK
ncbi:MAG: 16S rRNA (cytidine(1402)-2'-O)-methyltransferase [Holophagaceae bacterium]